MRRAPARVALLAGLLVLGVTGSTSLGASKLAPLGSEAPVNEARPAVSGLARVGETLTASPGSWSGAAPISFAYQWARCRAGYADVVRSRGPLGYWRLGEGSGSTAADSSAQSNHGAYGGRYALGQTGALALDPDRAVRLGGSAAGSMTVAHRSSLNVGNTVTYEAWVRLLRLPTSSAGADLVTKGKSTLLLRLLPTGQVSLWKAGDRELTRSTAALQVDGSYHHVVGVKAGSGIRISLDGWDVTGSVTNTSVSNSTSPLTLAANGMEADVDELALYSRGLSDDEVASAYAAGRDGVCAPVAGATGDTYLLGPDDAGAALRVEVTASNTAGSASARSDATDPVAPASPPVNTGLPALSGVAREGETLTASRGTWTGSEPIEYGYQWRRCDASGGACADVAGATAAGYELAAGDVGRTLRVAVTATNAGGTATAVSAASGVVAQAATAPANTARPTVSGLARAGETLTGSAGSWSGTEPIEYGYQWRRCDSAGEGCSDVGGATSAEYVLAGGDVGATLRLAVTASNAAGSAVAVSEHTAVVAGPPPPPTAPVNEEPPTVAGTPAVGETLTASPGTWSGTEPISYAYQWRRCASGYSSLVAAAGPIGYWRLGEASGSTAVDSSGLGHDGGYSGSFELGAPGAPALDPNRAVRIGWSSPSGTVVVPHAPSLNVGDAVTYEAWVRLRRLPAASTVGANIATKSSGTLVLRILPSGVLSVRRSGGIEMARSTTALAADDRYHHVVATKAGGAVGIYIDGTNVTGPVTSQTLTNSTTQLTIAGNNVAENRDGIDGHLDEFALYNRALSAAEVEEHYGAAVEGACEPIAGATGDLYTVSAADEGSALGVEVTATNTAGSATAGSAPTVLVTGPPNAPANTALPSVSGPLQAGETLAAAPGTWTGEEPLSFAYQWRRCDAGGGGCADIDGATEPTYTLMATEMGARMRVAVTASNAAGTATAVSAATPAVAIGYPGPSSLGAGERPTGSKPQSKLWWNDGAWWVSMWSTTSESYSIFRLDLATQTWIDTGTPIDARPTTRADTLWDGSHLYVASHVVAACGCSTPGFGRPSRLYRYSYDAAAKRYVLDSGFPVAINDTQSETLVIDKDSTGTLWATWAQDNKVFVNRTTGDDSSWGTPFVLPAPEAQNMNGDDISSVVAFGGDRVGVMWSNQNANTMYFAVHRDGDPAGTWQAPEAALTGTRYADDHINLHAEGSGRVLVAMKTSRDEQPGAPPTDPQMMLLDRSPGAGGGGATWTPHVAGTVADDHTRPIVLVDEESRKVHLFATAPTTPGGTIYHKAAHLDEISFPGGFGTPFMRGAGGSGVSLNDPTSTKQSVNATTGIVVVASERPGNRYWHNHLALGG